MVTVAVGPSDGISAASTAASNRPPCGPPAAGRVPLGGHGRVRPTAGEDPMSFHLLLFRDRPEAPHDPASLWADAVSAASGIPDFDGAAREAIAQALKAADPTLDRVVAGDDGSLSVVSSKGIGIDWHVDAMRVVAEPQVAGVKPAVAEAAFEGLLASVARLRDEHGLSVWSPELGRIVDPDADHEALARAWLRHCDAAAKAHLEATHSGSNLTMIGALVLIGLLVALAATPAAAHPLVVVPVSILLALGLIVAIARRARRRADP